jgi:type I restriction enzyme, S subunit
MKYPRYENYKDSGIEWLGEIPEHWTVMSLRHKGTFIGGTGFPNELQGETCEEFPFYKVSDMNSEENEVYMTKHNNSVSKETLAKLGANLFSKGTIIFPKVGAALLTNKRRIIAQPSCCDNNIMGYSQYTGNLGWLYYWFLGLDLGRHANPGAVPSINESQIKQLKIPFPNETEQRAIATFLDRETARIDKMIVKKERLIEMLEEKRSALISHAVTKGLDPDVPMKDSGIEWLGGIPKGWEVKRLKHLASVHGRIGFRGYTSEDLVDDGDGALTIGGKHIDKNNQLDLSNPVYINWKKYYESPEIMVQKNDLLIAQRGTLGKVLFIENDLGHATINPSLVLLNEIKHDGKYLYYQFNSNIALTQIEIQTAITAVPMISQYQIENLVFIVPPITEQRTIVNFLDRETTRIYELIRKNRQVIEKLKEYRTALISAAVTGKIDVRGEM